MLHFFHTDYFLREHSYHHYEFSNREIAKWIEYYFSQRVPFHQANWCSGRVTVHPDDILLGHPTYDHPPELRQDGLGSLLRDWVKNNALTPDAPCHPNSYIFMAWVPEFPVEWRPSLVHLESQLLAVPKIFTICSQLWFDRTLALTDDSIQSRVRHKLIRSNMGVAMQNLPRKFTYRPVGDRQLLHISTLGSYKGFDNTCASVEGLPTVLHVASKSLQADVGWVNATIGGKTYSFNFLGAIDNGDRQFNQWVLDTCDFYLHTGTMDAQATAILENIARGLIPLVTPESGFEAPDAVYLTHNPNDNRQIIARILEASEEELRHRSERLYEFVQREHHWEVITDKIWDRIQEDMERRRPVGPSVLLSYDPMPESPRVILPNGAMPQGPGQPDQSELQIIYQLCLPWLGESALVLGDPTGEMAIHAALGGMRVHWVVDNVVDHDARAPFDRMGIGDRLTVHNTSPEPQPWRLVVVGDGVLLSKAEILGLMQPLSEPVLVIFTGAIAPQRTVGLDQLRNRGWQTLIYPTPNYLGIAWRGIIPLPEYRTALSPAHHLPLHLGSYDVMGVERPELTEFLELLTVVRPFTMLGISRLYALYALTRTLCEADLPGTIVECGTCAGGAIALMAAVVKKYSQRPRRLFACDTFAGIPAPEDVDRLEGKPATEVGVGEGTLNAGLDYLNLIAQQLGVADLIVPVEGLFAQTLPQWRHEIGAIALLHADGDWYQSTREILEHLFDQVVPDGVIQFDDYHYWEGCQKAVDEFWQARSLTLPHHTIDESAIWCVKTHLLPLLVAPDWESFPESLCEQLAEVILVLLIQQPLRPLAVYARPSQVPLADTLLSEVILALAMRPDVPDDREPEIQIMTEHPAANSVMGRLALECDCPIVARALDYLPVLTLSKVKESSL
ncbi:MAG: hypothetical protein HC919_04970 [Oscillatoriales cyanobacterium SM2_2_1]|nr:hypothetical protein [Oscillatoriales cyanobacterium SM2_2_1]